MHLSTCHCPAFIQMFHLPKVAFFTFFQKVCPKVPLFFITAVLTVAKLNAETHPFHVSRSTHQSFLHFALEFVQIQVHWTI